MEPIKNSIIAKTLMAVALICGLIGSIDAMKPNKFTYTVKHKSKQQPQRPFGLEDVWVQTSDGQIVAVPKWQIDQMKVLQVLFVSQNGTNSENNPIKALMVNFEELQLLQKAFELITIGKFNTWYKDIREEFNKSLTDISVGEGNLRKLTIAAEKVGATSLSALLAAFLLPIDVQSIMAPEIIEPVAAYLKPEKVLQGHQDDVRCVEFSPDSKYIVSGALGNKNNLILWNGKTGEQIKVLKGHQGSVYCVAFSSDGNYIVSGSLDNNLILWNGQTGEQIKVLEGHQGSVSCVAFSPDGNYIVSGAWGNKNNLILWNGKTGEQIKVLEGHQGSVYCVAFSSDGNYIVSGSKDGNLIVWNGKTGDQIKILQGYQGSVNCVAFSPDSKYIVSGSLREENNLILWNGKTGEQIKVLEGHQSSVYCVAFSSDGEYIVSGSDDNNLILWNGKTGEQIKILQGHGDFVCCVAFSPDGNYIVSGSDDNNLILWNGKTGQQIKILKGHTARVSCIAFSHDGNYIVSGSSDDNLILWKLVNEEALGFIKRKLTLSQARFLYRLYLAVLNKVLVIIDKNDLDYTIYKSLPENVQKLINTFLPFQLASHVFGQEVVKKKHLLKSELLTGKPDETALGKLKNFYRSFFAKSELTTSEKIKNIKQAMENESNKNSVTYKACQELLNELEIEAAFESETQ